MIMGHRVGHGFSAYWGCFKAPGPPTGIKVKPSDRREAHDGRKIGRHVAQSGPLAQDMDHAEPGKQIDQLPGKRFNKLQARSHGN